MSSAEDLDEVLELAAHNGTYAAVDSNALQYFAARMSLVLSAPCDLLLG